MTNPDYCLGPNFVIALKTSHYDSTVNIRKMSNSEPNSESIHVAAILCIQMHS